MLSDAKSRFAGKDDYGKISLIIADDHPLFRAGVLSEMENQENFKVIAEAEDGLKALKLINELTPDIAILDFQMPGLNGIEIAEKLQSAGSSTKTILLTMHNEKKIFLKAMNVGVKGYVLKNDALFDIINAVKTVFEGKMFISPNLTGHLVEKVNQSLSGDKNIELINSLTPTEKKILILISELNSNQEIAEKLFISKRTVENQKGNLTKKLLLDSAKDLLKFSIQYGEYLKQTHS